MTFLDFFKGETFSYHILSCVFACVGVGKSPGLDLQSQMPDDLYNSKFSMHEISFKGGFYIYRGFYN